MSVPAQELMDVDKHPKTMALDRSLARPRPHENAKIPPRGPNGLFRATRSLDMQLL
jgi:hypothetical protein